MTDIDYSALRSALGGDPPDGMHQATLVRAAIVETSGGSRLVTEWQTVTGTPYYWTVWHGFEGPRLQWTQEYLDGLGLDRSKITSDEAFDVELENARGVDYDVRVETRNGYLNTYVEGPAANVQERLDLPIASDDLPPAPAAEPAPAAVGASTAASSDPADDDIPF
jgi:hypothetical protein